jgi:alkylhydroperoxidase/carboxymuconolactone decarboxylase family protein YurZ
MGARHGHPPHEEGLPLDKLLARHDPGLWAAQAALTSVPDGRLSAKDQRFIQIAVNASTAHLNVPAVRGHIRAALELGASTAEILEVLEMASVLGIHACTMAMPILAEVSGLDSRALGHGGRQQEVRARFEQGRGVWPGFFDDMVALDPDLVESYLRYSTVPWRRGAVSPKLRELVYIAIDTNVTHLYAVGTRMHIQNALRAGAGTDEIIEVLELVVQVGLDSCAMALPILDEEINQAER